MGPTGGSIYIYRSTVQQRWNACRVHSAAAELHEQLAAPRAAPVGDVTDTVASVLRQLGPRAPGLLHVDPREIGLADIDVVGRQASRP